MHTALAVASLLLLALGVAYLRAVLGRLESSVAGLVALVRDGQAAHGKALEAAVLGDGLTPRERRGRELAATAVAAVEQMVPAEAGPDKLQAALALFRRLDMRDGVRDYDDATARVLLEAAVARLK